MKISLKTNEIYDILYDLNVLPGKFILFNIKNNKIVFCKMHLFNKVLFERTLDVDIKGEFIETSFMIESSKLLSVLKDFRELDVDIFFDLKNEIINLNIKNKVLNINCQISLNTFPAEYPYIFNNYMDYFKIKTDKKISLNTLKIKPYLKHSILNTNLKNVKENTKENTLKLVIKGKRISIASTKVDYLYYSGENIRNIVIQNDLKEVLFYFPINIVKMLLKLINYKDNAILNITFSTNKKIIKIEIDNLILYFEIPNIKFSDYESIIKNHDSKLNNHISLLTYDTYIQLKPFLIDKKNENYVNISKNKFVVYNSHLKTELYCFADKQAENLRIDIKNLLLYITFIKTNKYINIYYNPKHKTYLLTNNKTSEIVITF